jgi:hypothetical protein
MAKSYITNRATIIQPIFWALEGEHFADWGGNCTTQPENWCQPFALTDRLDVQLPWRCLNELQASLDNHFTSLAGWSQGTGNGYSDTWTQTGSVVEAAMQSKILNRAVTFSIGFLQRIEFTLGTLRAGCVIKVVAYKSYTSDASTDYVVIGTIDNGNQTLSWIADDNYVRIGFYIDGTCELDSSVDRIIVYGMNPDLDCLNDFGGAVVAVGCDTEFNLADGSNSDNTTGGNTNGFVITFRHQYGGITNNLQCDCFTLETSYLYGWNLLPYDIGRGGTFEYIDSDGQYVKDTSGVATYHTEVSIVAPTFFNSYPFCYSITYSSAVNNFLLYTPNPIFLAGGKTYGVRLAVKLPNNASAARTMRLNVNGDVTNQTFIQTVDLAAVSAGWFMLETTFDLDGTLLQPSFTIQVEIVDGGGALATAADLNGDNISFDDLFIGDWGTDGKLYSQPLCLLECEEKGSYIEAWNDSPAFGADFSTFKYGIRVLGALVDSTFGEDDRETFVDAAGRSRLIFTQVTQQLSLNIQLSAPDVFQALSVMIGSDYLYIDGQRYTATDGGVDTIRSRFTRKQQAAIELTPYESQLFNSGN